MPEEAHAPTLLDGPGLGLGDIVQQAGDLEQ